MTHDEYAEHVKLFINEMVSVTNAKNADYSAGTSEAMYDYYHSSECAGIDPIQAWLVLYMKHHHAILRFVKIRSVSSESIHGRFIDMANYAMLGDALVKDMLAKQDTTWNGDDTNPVYDLKKAMDEVMNPVDHVLLSCGSSPEVEQLRFVRTVEYILQHGALRGDHHNLLDLRDCLIDCALKDFLDKFIATHPHFNQSTFINPMLEQLEYEVKGLQS